MFEGPELTRRIHARVGTTLVGKYRIDSVLGVGGMAAVYAATHRNQAEFAIKLLHPELSFREDVRTRFLREGYAANSVKHPGAVRVVDDDVAEDGAAFLVMELLQGVVVEALVERQGGRLAPGIALAIVDQLLDVLVAAHPKGIVHRDLKPANLFLTTDGTVKVLDFGIARAREVAADTGTGGKSTGTGMLLGTPAFMAPEQAMAKSNEIDAQTDLWAAAATLFSLLTGQYVHVGDNGPQLLIAAATQPVRPLVSVVPGVPPAVARVVDRGLSFDKAGRFPSATAMQQALREAFRATQGEVPSRSLLESLARDKPGAEAPVPPAPTLPITPAPSARSAPSARAATPGSWPASVPPASGTTSRPVSTRPGVSQPEGPRSTPRLGRSIGWAALVLVTLGGAAGLLGRARHGAAPAAVAPTSASTAASALLAPSALLPVPIPSASVDVPEASPPVSAAPTATPTHALPRQPVTRLRPAVNCNPPYTIDSAGHREPKPECL